LKNKLYILLLSLLPLGVWAENVEHEYILSLQYGGMWRQDQYLSPLLYKGMMVSFGNEWWQPYKKESKLGRAGQLDNWEHVGRFRTDFDWTYNSKKNNVLYASRIVGGWGTHYIWKWPQHGVQVLLGPYLSIDGTVKYHARNVNKPVSVDLALHTMAEAGVSYAFHGKKNSYRLRYIARANLIGVDCMPDYWQSYYEIGEKVQPKVRCAGMWNHRVIQQELTFDMQFRGFILRLGMVHEYDEYGEKNMMFSREQVSMVVGACLPYKSCHPKNYTQF